MVKEGMGGWGATAVLYQSCFLGTHPAQTLFSLQVHWFRFVQSSTLRASSMESSRPRQEADIT